MAHPSNREIEVKLRVSDVSRLRRLLRRLGAVSSGRIFESNTLYDDAQNHLRKSGRLLRLRVEIPARTLKPPARTRDGRLPPVRHALLTYKAPVPRKGIAPGQLRYKVREEVEVQVGDPSRLEMILGGLGLRPGFRYEKFRTTYRLPGLKNLVVVLDETPIGPFLELEGPKSAIDQAARRVGYALRDYNPMTYWSLYHDECRRRGVRPRNMVFTRRKN
ncbi:MAG: class IV adenylate cyclase [Candidatus Acidiferrales bacterium]